MENRDVTLREVRQEDLPAFFEHQRDPAANEMAAFPARERQAFMDHWTKILEDKTGVTKTILFRNQLAGNVVCFEKAGKRFIGYWIGREFWGKGIATRALWELLEQVTARPLHAYVAKSNIGSIRVLEKCGFKLAGENVASTEEGGHPVEEFLFTLAE